MADASAAARPRGELVGAFQKPFEWAWIPFKWFLWIVFFGGGTLGVILIGVWGYNIYKIGGSAAVATQTAVLLDKVGAAQLATALRTGFSRTISGESLFADSAVRSDIAASQRGTRVSVKDMQIINPPTYYGKAISVIGSLDVQNPPEDMQISATCSIDDITIDADISGQRAKMVRKGDDIPNLPITCTLPGVQAPTTATVFTPGGESLRKEILPTTPKRLVMAGRFTYASAASLGAYVYNRRDFDAFVRASRQGKPQTVRSIFAEKGISDSQISADGTVRSITSKGPVNIGLKTVRQPLVEDDLNILQVSVSSDLVWASQNNGHMKKLEAFELTVPDFLVLANDQDFPKALTKISCDFVPTGEKTERGEKIYKLSQEKLDLTNKECSKEALKGSSLSVAECEDLFGVGQTSRNYFCSFMLTKPFTDLKKAFIEAKISYLYEVQNSKGVNVSPEPGQVIGVA